MYRNNEYYSSPTEGRAIANVMAEIKRERRNNVKNTQKRCKRRKTIFNHKKQPGV